MIMQMNIWKIIYLNCRETYEEMIDHLDTFRTFIHIICHVYDQLPVGLIHLAQLAEHCTGTAEVKGLNFVQAWMFFFQALNSQLLNLCA